MTAFGVPRRRGRSRHTLRVEVLSIIAILILMFVLTEIIVGRATLRDARDAAVETSRFGAGLAAASISDSIFRAEELVSRTVNGVLMLGALDDPTRCDLPAGASGVFATGHVDLLLPSGRRVCSSLPADGASVDSGYAGQAWVRDVVTRRTTVVSPPFTDPLTSKLSVAVAAPVLDGARVLGIIADVLHLEKVATSLVETYGSVLRRRFTVVDILRGVILTTTESEVPPETSVDGTPFGSASEGGTHLGLDGVRRIYGEVAIVGLPWRVYSGIPEALALAPTRRALRDQLILTFMAAFLGVLAVVAVDRRIARPVRTLRDAVRRVGGSPGTEHAVVPTGPAEIADLAEEFNVMLAARAAYEASLHETNEELEARVDQRTAQLQRSNAELDRFASLAAHDLQEPLRTVGGFADLLSARISPDDTEALHLIRRIHVRTDRMRDLIADLLAYARAGTTEPILAPMDIAEAVTEAIDDLRGVIDDTEANITIGPLPRVVADASDLAKLFQNLIANAMKFRRPGTVPTVHVSAEAQDGMCVVSVADDGIGIDMRYATRIFEPFRRLHSSEEYPGTGMGLGICAKLVEKQGGRIWVESELGKGATFRFSLPGV